MTVLPRILTATVGLSGTGGMRFQSPTQIEVETEHEYSAKPNSAKIKLHNLSPGEVQWCEISGQVIQISAGEGIPSQIFLGDIRQRQTITESLPNGGTVTHVEARDCWRKWIDGIFSRSYPPGTSSSLILADAIQAMQVPIGYMSPSIVPIVFTGGYTFTGKAKDCITELVTGWAGTWTICHGAIYIFAPHDPTLPGATPILSAETGLMGSPKRKDRGGVECKCRFQPALNKIWMGFTVQSRWVNGIFKLSKVSHKLTSDGATWETQVEGVPVTT